MSKSKRSKFIATKNKKNPSSNNKSKTYDLKQEDIIPL